MSKSWANLHFWVNYTFKTLYVSGLNCEMLSARQCKKRKPNACYFPSDKHFCFKCFSICSACSCDDMMARKRLKTHVNSADFRLLKHFEAFGNVENLSFARLSSRRISQEYERVCVLKHVNNLHLAVWSDMKRSVLLKLHNVLKHLQNVSVYRKILL